MIGGGRPLLRENSADTDPPPCKKDDFRSIFCYNSASAVKHSEKSLINTNTESTMRFPTSLRWTSYIVPKPQRRAENRKTAHSVKKIALRLNKVCYSFIMWKLSARNCKAFIGLTIRAEMIGGDVSLKVNFYNMWTTLWRGCCAFTKFGEYSTYIAIITMKSQITNNVH